MPINQTIKEKMKEDFILLKKYYSSKTGEKFYLKHDKQLTEAIFNKAKGFSISQAKALVKTIESVEAQERYSTLYNYCKEILNISYKLKQLQTFNFETLYV